MVKRFLNISILLILAGCACVLASAYFPSDTFAYLSYLPLLTPVSVLLLLILAVINLFCKRWKYFFACLLLLLASANQWLAMGRFSQRSLPNPDFFKVLSYNVSFFKIPSVFSKSYFDPLSAEKGNHMIDWVLQQDAAIVCLQEFFNDTESSHHNYIARFKEHGYTPYFQAVVNPKNETLRGMVILSRFPVVGRGQIFMSENRYNGASYMDVLIQQDTLRIVNVHLESMELYFGNKGWKDRFTFFLTQFKQTMITRTKQTRLLNDFIDDSPYPIIVAGDFNETPYSYNHRVLKKKLTNSFEASGAGLGSTLAKGFLPIRIDHQYFSEALEVGDFTVGQSISLSDHFPIMARYSFKSH
jgi:endonuclease/exonuclease/phosphatase family metal-dependent hydrolase